MWGILILKMVTEKCIGFSPQSLSGLFAVSWDRLRQSEVAAGFKRTLSEDTEQFNHKKCRWSRLRLRHPETVLFGHPIGSHRLYPLQWIPGVSHDHRGKSVLYHVGFGRVVAEPCRVWIFQIWVRLKAWHSTICTKTCTGRATVMRASAELTSVCQETSQWSHTKCCILECRTSLEALLLIHAICKGGEGKGSLGLATPTQCRKLWPLSNPLLDWVGWRQKCIYSWN